MLEFLTLLEKMTEITTDTTLGQLADAAQHDGRVREIYERSVLYDFPLVCMLCDQLNMKRFGCRKGRDPRAVAKDIVGFTDRGYKFSFTPLESVCVDFEPDDFPK